MSLSDYDRVQRKLLFTPCTSKGMLHKWIKHFLKIDLPDCIVSDESNSSPMDLCWEIYDKALSNDDPEFSRLLAYASRGGYKTVTAAILQVLGVVHMKRDSGFLAAIRPQSKVAFGYFKTHFRKKPLAEFIVQSNEDEVKVSWYASKSTGDILTVKEYYALGPDEMAQYTEVNLTARVLVCTLSGLNSYHCVSGSTKIVVRTEGGTETTTVKSVFDGLAGPRAFGGDMFIAGADIQLLTPSFNVADGKMEWKPIVSASRTGEQGFLVKHENGLLECSGPHRVLTPQHGFVSVSSLVAGDSVFWTKDGGSVVESRIEAIKPTKREMFYDLGVEDNHNFFANGVLVHNCQLLIEDELDTVEDKSAYYEARNIPDPKGGVNPITFMTSTRKFSYGLVQEEIDEAAKTGLKIRHWNLIDVTSACPPDRHLPNEDKVKLYINDSELRHVTKDELELMDPIAQGKFYEAEGFAGCAKCPLFFGCKGRLATHQTSKSPLLKPILNTIQKFKENPIERSIAQLMCRTPESTGLICPRFNREVHMKTANEMARMIEDTPEAAAVQTKPDLIEFMKRKGARFWAGIDWGFSHAYAYTVFAQWGTLALVVECLTEAELEIEDKIARSQPLKEIYDATIYPDMESPSDIETFKRKGFKVKRWDKGKGSVKAGIEIIRSKLAPFSGKPTLYFLKDDPGCEYLALATSRFHFKTDAQGNISDIPAEEYKDTMDSIRYGIMNVYAKRGAIKSEAAATISIEPATSTMQVPKNWMSDVINKASQSNAVASDNENTDGYVKIKKKGFIFDL